MHACMGVCIFACKLLHAFKLLAALQPCCSICIHARMFAHGSCTALLHAPCSPAVSWLALYLQTQTRLSWRDALQGPRSQLLCGVHLLMLMFLANKAGPAGATIPNSEFYNAAVSHSANLQQEYVMWINQRVRGMSSFI